MKKTKVLLINPPTPDEFQANRDFMGGFGATNAKGITRVPPTALEYTAGMLKNKGFNVQTIDAAVETDRNLIYNSIADTAAVGSYCGTATFDDDLKFITDIKKRSGVFTFMFGPQVSLFPDYALNNSSLDALAAGEAETTVLELIVQVLRAKKAGLAGIPGLVWRSNGSIVRNSERPVTENLDTLPFPFRDKRNYDKYYYKENESPFVSVIGSRGCPYNCVYCPYPISQGTKFRARTPKNIIEELKAARKEIDFKMILFRDPVFSFDRQRTIVLCKMLKENFPNVAWRCETTTRNVDENLLAIMKSSGCAGINFGIETGSPALIDRYAKKTGGLEHIKEIFFECKRAGLYTIGFFIVGLPGETRQTLKETLKFAKIIDPDDINFTAAVPFPGTELYKQLLASGAINGNEFASFRTSNCISSTKDISAAELQKEIINMYMSFYSRPKRLIYEFARNPLLFLKKVFAMFFLLMQGNHGKK